MNRLTTNDPQTNFETMLNMVYGKDGWGYIRHGEDDMKITDFCLMLCKERECNVSDIEHCSDEAKDDFPFECNYVGCPVATIYSALCGYCHVRSRLKKYEDAGMMPPVDVLEDKSDENT